MSEKGIIETFSENKRDSIWWFLLSYLSGTLAAGQLIVADSRMVDLARTLGGSFGVILYACPTYILLLTYICTCVIAGATAVKVLFDGKD